MSQKEPGTHIMAHNSRKYGTNLSSISEIIYDASTEIETANKKSHDSFQVEITLAIFQGH